MAAAAKRRRSIGISEQHRRSGDGVGRGGNGAHNARRQRRDDLAWRRRSEGGGSAAVGTGRRIEAPMAGRRGGDETAGGGGLGGCGGCGGATAAAAAAGSAAASPTTHPVRLHRRRLHPRHRPQRRRRDDAQSALDTQCAWVPPPPALPEAVDDCAPTALSVVRESAPPQRTTPASAVIDYGGVPSAATAVRLHHREAAADHQRYRRPLLRRPRRPTAFEGRRDHQRCLERGA